MQGGQIRPPILHWARNDTVLTSDWLVAKIINHVLGAVDSGFAIFNSHLQVVEHLKVAFLEHVSIRVLVLARSEPNGVDSEECSKFLDHVTLFDICLRLWCDPEFLGIISDLEIDEAHGAE